MGYEYLTYQKTAGLVGSLKDFFQRRTRRHAALVNVDLTVQPGEMIGLLGPNGAGKTTLMKVLAGLIQPTSGSVTVLGHQPYRKASAYLRQIGLVLGQKSQLMWDLPPSDSLLFLKALYGVGDREYQERLAFLLDALGVAHLLNTPVRKLSLGERMKFELVAALLHQPRLLLLDEPTIGLDIASQRAIHAFLRAANQRLGTTIILTSHYVRDVEALADRLVILQQGRLQYDGALSHLLTGRHETTVLRVETRGDLRHHALGFRYLSENRWECEIAPETLTEALIQVASAVRIDHVTTQKKPLEDILYAMFVGARQHATEGVGAHAGDETLSQGAE